jgi:hypothetical protein
MVEHSKFTDRTTTDQLLIQARERGLTLVCIDYASNLLDYPFRLGSYIINMGHNTHWVALYINVKEACYFDSFGMPPPTVIEKFLAKRGRSSYLYSTIDIQDLDSGGCGEYCIEWIEAMTYFKGGLKSRYEKYLNQFSKNPKLNRAKLKKLYMDVSQYRKQI